MMKVYILTDEPFPNGMAATNRIKCYARAIKEGGLDCEIVVCRRTEVYGKKAKNINGKGTFNGIPFHYMGGTPLRGSNVLIRQINDKIDAWRTKRYLRRNLQKGDVLFLYMERQIKLVLLYMSIVHSKGAFCVRDLCELPFGTGSETGRAVRLRKITLEKQFPSLDGIISISDALLNLAKKYTLRSCEHIKVPILIDFDQYYIENKSENENMPFIFHAGTLYEQKDGILGMIEAFGIASQKINVPLRFISTGNINNTHDYEREHIKSLIAKYHLEDKLFFTDYISNEQLKEYLSKALLVIINKYPTQQNEYCFSTKLGEYLAAAKPLIITNVGEAMNWLKDGKNAIVVESNDIEALANSIIWVINNSERAKQLGLMGQELCRGSFDYHNWTKTIKDFLLKLNK